MPGTGTYTATSEEDSPSWDGVVVLVTVVVSGSCDEVSGGGVLLVEGGRFVVEGGWLVVSGG